MKIKCLIVWIILLPGLGTGMCRAKGLVGAFDGTEDPTKDREKKIPKNATEAVTPQAKTPLEQAPDVLRTPPDPEMYDKRIQQLESLTPQTVKPVSGLEAAERRIRQLQGREKQLRLRYDKKTSDAINELAEKKKQMEADWMKLLKAMKDGKERSPQEWAELAGDLLGSPDGLEDLIPAVSTAAAMAQAADDYVNIPEVENLDTEKETPDARAFDDNAPLLEPVSKPTPKTQAPVPDFMDLIQMVRQQAKPETMHPFTWARLMDRFERDLADFRVSYVAVMKELTRQRKGEYDQVVEALDQAQRTYANLKNLSDNPGEAFRRHLAYRIYQAELAQLKLARSDLQKIAQERNGEKVERTVTIRTNPMAPEKTLMDLGRMIDLSGTPDSPAPDAFNALTAEGLPDLYPAGQEIIKDDKVHYGNLVKANIQRYQARLHDIRNRSANAETLVRRKERRKLRQKASDLRHQDRMDGRQGHPLNEARNREILKQMYQEMKADRTEHIQQLKDKLDREAQVVIGLLEAAYKRLDAMRSADD